jgi:hypothetical protein
MCMLSGKHDDENQAETLQTSEYSRHRPLSYMNE